MSEDEYQVEQVIGRRVRNGKVEYKIKWEGFPISDSTWEPLSHLNNVIDMVKEYDRKQPISEKEGPERERSRSTSPNPKQKKKKLTNEKQGAGANKRKSQISVDDFEEDSEKQPKKDKKTKTNADKKENEKEGNGDIQYIKVVSINKDFKADVLVEKNGIASKITIPTSELKKFNPDILIDFYESKIKFTVKHDK